jgi:hypothetical protein
MTKPLHLPGPAAVAGIVLSLVLVGSGCSGSESGTDAGGDPATSPQTSAPPTAQPYTGYPDSIAVLGHSGATGEGSGGDPGVEVRENSWATGTNRDVNSVYLRILQHNEAIKGHAYNLAQGGANLSVINAQAEAAVELDPAPELVLVQAIDNDLVCPAGDPELQMFEDELTQLLTTLSEGLPGSRFFLTTQDSSAPSKEAATLSREERQQSGGTGPCAIFDSDGRVVPAEVRRLEEIIARYTDRLSEVCDRFERCYHDPAVFEFVAKREFRTPDLNHDSVAGLANNADVAWSALRQGGLVPAG